MSVAVGIKCPVCSAPSFYKKEKQVWRCTRMSCAAETNQYNWKGEKREKKNGKKFEG